MIQDRDLQSDGEESAPSFAEYLNIILDNRYLVFGVAILMLLIGVVYAFAATPIYQSDLLIQIEDNSNSEKSSLGDISSLFDVKAVATGEIEVIKSRLVIGGAVRKINLDVDISPRKMPVLGGLARLIPSGDSVSPLSGLLGFAWGGEEMTVGQFTPAPRSLGKAFVVSARSDGAFSLDGEDMSAPVIGKVGQPLTFQTTDGTGTLLISTLTGKPGASFNVSRFPVNDVISGLQNNLKIVEQGKDSGVISVTYQDKSPLTTANILNAIGSEYVNQNVARKSAETAKTIDYLQNQLPDLRARLDDAEQKYNNMRSRLGTIDVSEGGKLILQQSVSAESAISALKQQQQQMLARFTPNHPAVQTINSQIAAAEQDAGSIRARITALPKNEQEIVRLTRDVTVDNDLYVNVLNNVQQLKVVQAGKIGNIRLVDVAVPAQRPIKPNKVLVIALALVLGVFFGIVAAVIGHVFFSGVIDTAVIEAATNLPVVATVPHSARSTSWMDTDAAPVLVAAEFPQDLSVEALRSLRTALRFSLLGKDSGVISITGPTPGVGKSFIAANLAVVLSTSDKKVLLVDGDMRKGALNRHFNAPRAEGLSEALSSPEGYQPKIHVQVLKNLDFLATGAVPPNPAELLIQPKLKSLLAEWRQRYDYVIIDTPPVLAVTDAVVQAESSDVTLIVTKAGSTGIGEIEETIRRLAQGGGAIKGIIFNDVPTDQRRFSKGSRYGGYRYEYYSYEGVNKTNIS